MTAAETFAELLSAFREPRSRAEAEADAAWPEPLGRVAPTVAVGAGCVEIPADLATVMGRRRSTRQYSGQPLEPAAVLAGVRAGLAIDRRLQPGEQRCCPFQPVIIARRVGTWEPGIYVPAPDGDAVEPVLRLPDPRAFEEMNLQHEYAAAAAVVVLLGNLEAAARHGGHGYRRLMTRAGSTAYAIWLDAVAHGMTGSVFAGFLPSALRDPLRCDGVSRHQLFAVALGDPAPAPAAAAAPQSPRPGTDQAGPPEYSQRNERW